MEIKKTYTVKRIVMNEEKIYSVLKSLPSQGQRVWCYGHSTYCCKEDMEEEAGWHKAIFSLKISSYILKKQMPEDIEESVLEDYQLIEYWDCGDPEGQPIHVIGVTRWKRRND